MGFYFVPQPGSLPQTSNNRTKSELVDDILEFVGGEGDKDDQRRAGRALDSSVRRFNTSAWRFNRRQEEITFLDDTAEYTLAAAASFRNPLRMRLLDASDVRREYLPWVRWEDWTKFDPDQSSKSSVPHYYTIRDAHTTATVIFSPPLAVPTSRPKALLDYHIRIVLAADNAVLQVPAEVEEALVAEAVAIMIAKTRTFEDAQGARASANALFTVIRLQYKDWPDSAGHME